jgi:hypothetical protein
VTAIGSLWDIAAVKQSALRLDGLDHLGQGAAALLAVGQIVAAGNGHFASHITGRVPFADGPDRLRTEFLGWFHRRMDWQAHGELLGWADVRRPEVVYVLYSAYAKAMRAAGRAPLSPKRIGKALHYEGLLFDRDVEREPRGGTGMAHRYTKTVWLNGATPHAWCVRTKDVFGSDPPANNPEEKSSS